MGKKKRYALVILMGFMMLMLCPSMVSAASEGPQVTEYSGGMWKRDNTVGKKYYTVNNKKVTGWAKIAGQTYYFNKNGYMVTGWKKYNGDYYYFTERSLSGAMVTGKYTDDQGYKYYFYKTGASASGTFKLKDSKGTNNYYYADPKTHKLATKTWKKVSGKYYFFKKNGVRYSGWFTRGKKTYYCSPKKGKLSGWNKIDGDWYYFKNSGAVCTNQWIVKGSKRCYVDHNGKMEKSVGKSVGNSEDYTKILMVGDSRFSRTIHNYGITADNITWISKAGEGYAWLSGNGYFGTSGYSKIKSALEKEAKAWQNDPQDCHIAIVFNMGVNDLDNVSKYIKYLNSTMLKLANQYECDLYYASVNPVCESKLSKSALKKKSNTKIKDFNSAIKTGLPDYQYINTYNYLNTSYNKDTDAMTLNDGRHYTKQASQIIFNKIMMQLKFDQ